MPRSAVTHIQKSAPGPPQWIAIATPAMLPMPTVAESAVVRAWKWGTSPGSSGSSYFPVVTAMPWPRWRSWMNPSRIVRKTPTPSRAITMSESSPPISGHDQTKYSSRPMMLSRVSMKWAMRGGRGKRRAAAKRRRSNIGSGRECDGAECEDGAEDVGYGAPFPPDAWTMSGTALRPYSSTPKLSGATSTRRRFVSASVRAGKRRTRR